MTTPEERDDACCEAQFDAHDQAPADKRHRARFVLRLLAERDALAKVYAAARAVATAREWGDGTTDPLVHALLDAIAGAEL